jgi:hypothetical protein
MIVINQEANCDEKMVVSTGNIVGFVSIVHQGRQRSAGGQGTR